MKDSAFNHSKMRMLKRHLNTSILTATGIVARLWWLARQEAKAGNIGRLSDEAIADAIGWEDEPAELIAALVKAGWLDEHPEHRLVIHDWPEHCEDTVHAALARRREWFADGTAPKLTKLAGAERAEAEAFYHGAESNSTAHPGTKSSRKQPNSPNGGNIPPNSAEYRLPKPEPKPKPNTPNTLMAAQAPDESETREAAERERAEAERLEKKRAEAEAKKAAELELGAQWASFLEEYPPRVGDRGLQPGRQKFEAILRNRRATFAQLLEGVQRYRRWCDHEGQTNTKFVKQIPTWLNQGCWGEDWTIIPRPNAGSSSSPTGRNRLSRADAEAIVAAAGLLEVA